MSNHSKLSASSSHRWILCPGSANAEALIPDKKNKYSEEGTFAHEIANKILNKEDISNLEVSSEMLENIKIYIDYIDSICDKKIWHPTIYTEKQVYYDHIIPNNFGTADVIMFYNNNLHIIDFKYGMNKVEAYNNSQLLLYASGAINTLKLSNIEQIHLHIVQPRINHFDKCTIFIKDLLFFEGYVKAKAEEALKPDAPLTPSEKACKWCKAKTSCSALYKFTSDLIESTKNTPGNIETKKILDNSEMVKNFLNSIEEDVYNKLLQGESFPGYKLVEGRNIRKIKNENVFELLGEKAYIKSTIGITSLEKMVDKETLKSLIYQTKGKPLLVKKDDKRNALKREELNFESFEE